MLTAPTVAITEEQKRQFNEEGYFILERVIPEGHLEVLRGECQRYLDAINAEMDRGINADGLNHRNKRYFIGLRHEDSPGITKFLFSPLMADVCRATLGPEAYLFYEQFVVKCAEVGMKFSWHQDSGYVQFPHKPYLTCWCPLDDVNEANGTVYVLPYSRAGTREKVKHDHDPESKDLVGYHGKDPGVPVNVPAGSIAIFSSHTFHRSGANTTHKMRRVYVAQYSAEAIIDPKTGKPPMGFAKPFLKGGEIIHRKEKP